MEIGFPAPHTLYTQRLCLRQAQPQDAQVLYEMRRLPAVVRYTGVPLYTELQQAVDYMARLKPGIRDGDCGWWAICPKGSEKMIGCICLWNPNADRSQYDIGYELHPDYHGKGYMREAVQGLLAYAFGPLNLQAVAGDPHTQNVASTRLLELCGFVCEPNAEAEAADHRYYRLTNQRYLGLGHT